MFDKTVETKLNIKEEKMKVYNIISQAVFSIYEILMTATFILIFYNKFLLYL